MPEINIIPAATSGVVEGLRGVTLTLPSPIKGEGGGRSTLRPYDGGLSMANRDSSLRSD